MLCSPTSLLTSSATAMVIPSEIGTFGLFPSMFNRSFIAFMACRRWKSKVLVSFHWASELLFIGTFISEISCHSLCGAALALRSLYAILVHNIETGDMQAKHEILYILHRCNHRHECVSNCCIDMQLPGGLASASYKSGVGEYMHTHCIEEIPFWVHGEGIGEKSGVICKR